MRIGWLSDLGFSEGRRKGKGAGTRGQDKGVNWFK
jgi:hypothetical protein